MNDAIRSLERYGSEVDDLVAPITPMELETRSLRRTKPPGHLLDRPWVAAVAVAAMILVVLGGGSILLGGAAEAPSAELAQISETPTSEAVSNTPANQAPMTVTVEIAGISGRSGYELAGVVYEGEDLRDLSAVAVGGFSSLIDSGQFTATQTITAPSAPQSGLFPHVTDDAVFLDPGMYTVVLWMDTSLSAWDRWVPINTDGRGLYGCHHVFEVDGVVGTAIELDPTFVPNGWNTDCTTGEVIPGTDADAAVNPSFEGSSGWGHFGDLLPTEMPALVPSEEGQSVEVSLSGVSDHGGHELAGVLYRSGELSSLDQDAIGGFWAVVEDADFSVTAVIREPDEMFEGRFPYVAADALVVEPGIYTLVMWIDMSLGGEDRWVPINTDGRGLYGCHHVFEVDGVVGTAIELDPTFVPNGWNTDCTTGEVIPGTDADAAVNPHGRP